jgi:arginase family enzyme
MSDIDFIKQFLIPVDNTIVKTNELLSPYQLGNTILINQNNNELNFENVKVAIVGITEQRNAVNNFGTNKAPDLVRSEIYKLSSFNNPTVIADLGNINEGASARDTYYALGKVVEYCLKKEIIPIVIGGSNDNLFGQFLGYSDMEMEINIVHADDRLDVSFLQEELVASNYLTHIFTHKPNYLKNFSLIGYQTYLVDYNLLKILDQMKFEHVRLGALQEDVKEIEPWVRDADILSIDISAVRCGEAPGNNNASPNGLFGHELCAMARYAGMSDKVSSLGIYEINPEIDQRNQTTQLAAQAIWYFIDGVLSRVSDYPIISENDFMKYAVHFHEENQQIEFLKSKKSNRWWMKVPKGDKGLYQLIPCSYSDYEYASNLEQYPNRWIKASE